MLTLFTLINSKEKLYYSPGQKSDYNLRHSDICFVVVDVFSQSRPIGDTTRIQINLQYYKILKNGP